MMSEEKLSSDEVPQKLTEWLLKMGCPPEKVPSLNKITQMCRGQYYMVWRSMMEHVKPKEIIKDRRLQVFCDDVDNYEKRNVFSEQGSNKVVPEEILLWRQQTELRDKVHDAEQSVATKKQNLRKLTDQVIQTVRQCDDKVIGLTFRNRREFQMSLAIEDYTIKKTNLEETKRIAVSLCTKHQDNAEDIKSKLDSYLSVCARPAGAAGASTPLLATNPVACSSVASTTPSDQSDEEQLLSSLAGSGPQVFNELLERRNALTQKLIAGNTATESPVKTNSVTPQWVISETVGMQSTFDIEAMKNRIHITNTRKRLETAVSEVNNCLTSSEASELLVLSCERACAGARVKCLRELLEEVTSRQGLFRSDDGSLKEWRSPGEIAVVDKEIENKKEELKKLISTLSSTEGKCLNVRDFLVMMFRAFSKEIPNGEIANYKGIQLDLPKESIAKICQLYRERRQSKTDNHKKIAMHRQLGFDLKVINVCSEVELYVTNFYLENNRRLTLESGRILWLRETVSSQFNCLEYDLQLQFANCTNVAHFLTKLMRDCEDKVVLEKKARKMAVERKAPEEIDIEKHMEAEELIHDKIKKRLDENLITLQKTNKTIDLGVENLRFWDSNCMKKYISSDRKINGKSYQDHETYYLENLC